MDAKYPSFGDLDLPERTELEEREYRRGYRDGWIQATQVVCGLLFLKNRTVIYNIMREQWESKLLRWLKQESPLSIMDWPPPLHGHSVKCVYCGQLATTMDHIVPVSKGGSNDLSNLVPACSGCNASKGAKSLAEWRGGRYASMTEGEDG